MTTFRGRALQCAAVGAALLATAAASVSMSWNPAGAIHNADAPCVNGVVPGNPYVVNCNLPPRHQRIPGQAPDAGAIIACRGIPGCLKLLRQLSRADLWAVRHTVTGTRSDMRLRLGRENQERGQEVTGHLGKESNYPGTRR
jgi:hypothetical protein